MRTTNIVISKLDSEPIILGVNVVDVSNTAPDININIKYEDLSSEEKLIVDNFYDLSIGKTI